jgi:hypothetical protein
LTTVVFGSEPVSVTLEGQQLGESSDGSDLANALRRSIESAVKSGHGSPPPACCKVARQFWAINGWKTKKPQEAVNCGNAVYF